MSSWWKKLVGYLTGGESNPFADPLPPLRGRRTELAPILPSPDALRAGTEGLRSTQLFFSSVVRQIADLVALFADQARGTAGWGWRLPLVAASPVWPGLSGSSSPWRVARSRLRSGGACSLGAYEVTHGYPYPTFPR